MHSTILPTVPTSISGQIAPHLDPPVCPCHSSTEGSLANHWPQRSSFWLVGAPIKCPPPPPISLQHSVHAHVCMHSESGRISTFGHVCLSLPAILEDHFTTYQP